MALSDFCLKLNTSLSLHHIRLHKVRGPELNIHLCDDRIDEIDFQFLSAVLVICDSEVDSTGLMAVCNGLNELPTKIGSDNPEKCGRLGDVQAPEVLIWLTFSTSSDYSIGRNG